MVGTRGSAHHGNCSNRKPNTLPRSIGLGGGAESTDGRSGRKARYKCADSNGINDEACQDMVKMFWSALDRECFRNRSGSSTLAAICSALLPTAPRNHGYGMNVCSSRRLEGSLAVKQRRTLRFFATGCERKIDALSFPRGPIGEAIAIIGGALWAWFAGWYGVLWAWFIGWL